ncbi:reverse transcriptase domain-containing protein [Phocaeicola massiliensis]|uniref:reverse transcriptase domain-containing protein n=1 Tax=Phocaeicola massiliensis TaxID=204516 RepID=UPI0034A55F63
MRREGYIVEEIIEPSNMEDSFNQVLRGTKRKRSRQGRYLLAHKEEVLDELTASIASGSFRVKDYHERDIVEGGKLRRIQVLSMKDRIAVHAIMTIVDKHLRKRFIRTTSASVKKRGPHDLMAYIRRDMKDDPEGTQFCYKFDIRRFYESVKQDFVMYCVNRIFKDQKLIVMLDNFVRLMPEGISIGLRSSQGLGNLLLSVYLDHFLKDKYGIRYYYRYCDDGVVLGKTKEELWKIRDAVHERINSIGLSIKPNERVFPVGEGIDFLGYVIYAPDHVRLRKRIKQKFARKMHEVKSRRRRRELMASFYGMAKHADCNKLYYKLTGKKMRSFKDLNVSYKPEDGKKRFPGTVVSIRELVNLPIIVKDFETGIKTEQGEDRCIVSIEQNGEPKKFFTNSEEMKNILAQVREMPDGFPFETTIKTETFGKGRTKYVFT